MSHQKINALITASGSYLPKKILTNNDITKTVDTSDEWILARTGIKQRHIADDDELTSDLAVKACKNLFKNSKIKAKDIELIVVATTTPDLTFPSTATIIQNKLGANNAFAFDVQAVCSGFVYALTIANNFIISGQVKNALVIGAETLSRIVNWDDRNTCILFGDGAGAVLLEATNEENRGILSSKLCSDGSLTDILKTSGGTSFSKNSGFIEMAGKEVFKHAVNKMSNVVFEALELANLNVKDIDILIPHQANMRILDSVASKLGIDPQKVIKTVENHANTSAASIPLALDFALKENKIKEGDIVVFEALGGGLTWGAVVIKW